MQFEVRADKGLQLGGEQRDSREDTERETPRQESTVCDRGPRLPEPLALMGMSQGFGLQLAATFRLFNSSFFQNSTTSPQISLLTGLFLFKLNPRSSHAPTLTRWPPAVLPQETPCRSNSEFWVLHPRNPLSPARAASGRRPHGSGTNRKTAMLGPD